MHLLGRLAIAVALVMVPALALPAGSGAQDRPAPLLGYSDNFNRFELHKRNSLKDILPPLPIQILPGEEGEDPDPERARLLKLARKGGAGVVRYVVPWMRVERKRGEFDFSFEDSSYQLALDHGVKPLIILVTSPCWAHPSVPCESKQSAVRPDPAFLPEWGRFVRAAVERYPEAVAFEIWNEANAERFWGPDPSPAGYRDLLAEAHRATRDIAGRPPILFNGLMPDDGWLRFLRRSYRKLGAGALADGTGIHPYVGRRGALAARKSMRSARRILRAVGAQQRLWVTEIGWSTNPNAGAGVSPEGQARRITRFERLATAMGSRSMVIHRLQDIEHPHPWESSLGVIQRDGKPKPLYCRLSLRFSSGEAC